jgi:hypothetical protein
MWQRHGRRRKLSARQRRTKRRGKTHRRRGSLFHWFRDLRFLDALPRVRFGPHRLLRNVWNANRLRRRRTLGDAYFRPREFRRSSARGLAGHAFADLQSHVVVERAGVRLFVGNAQLGQRLKDHVGLYFELAGQLIDTDFTHTITFRRRKCPDNLWHSRRTNFHESSASPFTESGEAAGTSVLSILSDSFSNAFSFDA